MTDVCLWCGAPMERLCDTLLHVEIELRRVDDLGREREPLRRLQPIGSLVDIPTCDAPICARCATSRPVFDVRGSSYDDRIETLDRCPYCVTQGPHAHLRVDAVGHRERCREHGAQALACYQAKPDAEVVDLAARRRGEP